MTTALDASTLLHPSTLRPMVTAWLAEDCPSFDWGGAIVGDTPSVAHLYAKSPGVLAGRRFFDEAFDVLGGCE